MKKKYVIICISLVVLILVILLSGEKKKVRKNKVVRAPLTVDTTTVSFQDYDVSKGYIGTLYPSRTFELNSQVGGRIVQMNYDIGDTIQNGATIARIDDVQYALELRQAEGRLDIERSKIAQKKMTIEMAKTEYERMLALREEKVVSESSLEKAKFDFEQKKLTFDVDQANLKMQETAVEISRLKWESTEIKAQWATEDELGTRVLAERFVDLGDMITPSKSIATIIDIGLLTAEIFVGEREYPLIKTGMRVMIAVDAFPDMLFEGKVARVAPFINEKTRQAKVVIRVANKELRLRPGMFARTTVIFKTRTHVPMLPRVCITEEQDVKGVFLYNPATRTVSFLPVCTGAMRAANIEIKNADEIDRPVVFIGQHMLHDGDHVTLVEKNPMSEESLPSDAGPAKTNEAESGK